MISELEKLLLRGGEGLGKLKRTTLGDIGKKGVSLAKAGYQKVKAHPGAAAIGAGAGGAAGYALGGDHHDEEEEQERLSRMLEYIRGEGGE